MRMKIPSTRAWFPRSSLKRISRSVEEILAGGYLSQGAWVQRFESEWSQRLKRRCVATSNGTSALILALRIAFSHTPHRHVIVPASTIYADAYAVERAGGTVVFADVDSTNGCLRASDISAAADKKTAGVCVTHLGGMITPEIEQIRRLCSEEEWFLIEDAAHAHGSMREGRYAGTWGDYSVFSFFNTKVVTCGEGGLVCCTKESDEFHAKLLRDQGLHQEKNKIAGGNARMSELSACVGVEQTRILPTLLKKRRLLASLYDTQLRKCTRISLFPPEARGEVRNYYKYIVRVHESIDRDTLIAKLRTKHNIPMPGGVYYTPCHLQPVWNGLYREGDFPGAESWARHHLCLPLTLPMTAAHVSYVCRALQSELG